MRLWHRAIAATLVSVGCLPDITAPPCETDEDCASCAAGPCHCSGGYCFADQAAPQTVSVTLPPCTTTTPALAQDACCSEAGELDPECVATSSVVYHPIAGIAVSADATLLLLEERGATLTLVASDAGGATLAEVPIGDTATVSSSGPVALEDGSVLLATPSPRVVDVRRPASGVVALYANAPFGPVTGSPVLFPSGRVVLALLDGRLLDLESSTTAPRAVTTGWSAAATQLVGFDVATVAATVTGGLRLFDVASGSPVAKNDAVELTTPLVLAVPSGTTGAVLGITGSGRVAGLARRQGAWEPVETEPLPGAASTLASLSRDRFVALSADGATAWWLTLTGNSLEVTGSTSFTPSAARHLASEPEGVYVTLETGAMLHLVDATTGENWRTAPGQCSTTVAPIIAPDGTLIAVGADGRVRRFPARTSATVPARWSGLRGGPAQTGWAPLE